MKKFKYIFLILIPTPFYILFLLCPFQLQASSTEDLKQDIQKEKDDLGQKKRTIKKLSRRESQIYSNLAQIEKKMQGIQSALKKSQIKFSALKDEEATLLKKYQRTRSEHKKIRNRLQQSLSSLWPAYCTRMSSGLGNLKDWAELDRKIQWLRAVSERIHNDMKELRDTASKVTSSLAKLEKVKEEVRQELERTEQLKDTLLQKKLDYLSQVQEIRAKRLVSEKRVQSILNTIESLNYKLRALTEKKFAKMKGYLPWPCKGIIRKNFQPQSNPPQRGIGIKAEQGTKIKSVFWGKVVHNDKLRGFGKVIIIYHGDDYYSLYAFLNSSVVKLGQRVEKGETIGRCGFYPELKSEGLYFELRFHQKAINPMNWLSS
ncbi:MAG: murein hydrolase activator EnvC family protein [Thermodesulfobacteriota bacterium]